MDAAICADDVIATLLVDAPHAEARDVQPGQIIGERYHVERMIGRGGYAAVFEATHTGTGQHVALKCLSYGSDGDADTRARRFFQEARVTASLTHENNIRVMDFGQDYTGLLYIAMELLVGRTLGEELRVRRDEDRPFTQEEAVAIAVGVTRGLEEAHAANLVHRDLKPDNIFLAEMPDGLSVKVLDFGIVRVQDSTITLGSHSGVPGTPAYMSPEQATKDAVVDARSDLYALGVILYQMLSGEVPFHGEDVVDTLHRHATTAPEPIARRTRCPISESLATLIHASLAKHPDRRPANASVMRAALEASLSDPRATRPRRRGPGVFAYAAVLVGVLLGVTVLILLRPARPPSASIPVEAPRAAGPSVPEEPPPPAESARVDPEATPPRSDTATVVAAPPPIAKRRPPRRRPARNPPPPPPAKSTRPKGVLDKKI